MIGKVYKKQGGSGGGEIINGIIEQYKASTSTISPNSFVEFALTTTYGTDTIVSGVGEPKYNTYSAQSISETKQMVAKADTSSKYLYFYPFTGETTLTVGTTTSISTTYTPSELITAQLNDGKILALYGGSSSNYKLIDAYIIDASGDTTTVGSRVTILSGSQSSYSGYGLSAVYIGDNKVFITYRDTSTKDLMGVVCTISGTTLTKGTPTSIESASNLGYDLNARSNYLDNGNIAVIYNDGSTGYGRVVNVSGTTITVGTRYNITTHKGSSGQARDRYDVIKLDKSHLFIIYIDDTSIGNSTYPMTNYGRIVTISGTSMTQGSEYTLATGWYNSANSGILFGVARIFENKVVLFGDDVNGQRKLYRVECEINGTTISVGTKINMRNVQDTILNVGDYNNFGITYTSSKIWVFHPTYSSGYKTGYFYVIGDKKIALSSSKINGITKEETTTSTAGDVWVLNN